MSLIVTKKSMCEALAEPAQHLSPAEKARHLNVRMHYIGRALCILLDRQTIDERNTNHTAHHNNRGFAPCDAREGSLSAKAYRKYGTLQDWQVQRWLIKHNGQPRLVKYHRQLNQAAEAKAKTKNVQSTLNLVG